jgi:enoyl-[acyl-carrier-protein] reductase (NADH)
VKRFVATDEVAALLAFLASPMSSGITGALLPVDLGTLAW